MAAVVTKYRPQNISTDHWEIIGPFVREAAADVVDSVTYRTRPLIGVVGAYVHWCWQTAGIELERPIVFSVWQVEEFIASGAPKTWSTSTRGDHRSLLLRVCEALGGIEGGVRLSPLSKADPQAPYTPREVVRLCNWASTQTTAAKRQNAWVLLSLGLGAGLARGEVVLARPDDVVHDSEGVLVHVRGNRERAVPVLATWEGPLLASVARSEPGSYLFRPGRTAPVPSKNLVSEFTSRCSPITPSVNSHRLRGTWLVTHLSAGTPLPALIDAAGVSSLTPFERYLPFLADDEAAHARQQLRLAFDRNGRRR